MHKTQTITTSFDTISAKHQSTVLHNRRKFAIPRAKICIGARKSAKYHFENSTRIQIKYTTSTLRCAIDRCVIAIDTFISPRYISGCDIN